jgi:hypothetical protein
LNGGTNQLEKNTSISFSVAVADAVIVVAVVAAVVMLAIPDTHATTAQHHWMDGWVVFIHPGVRDAKARCFSQRFLRSCVMAQDVGPSPFPPPSFAHPALLLPLIIVVYLPLSLPVRLFLPLAPSFSLKVGGTSLASRN